MRALLSGGSRWELLRVRPGFLRFNAFEDYPCRLDPRVFSICAIHLNLNIIDYIS